MTKDEFFKRTDLFELYQKIVVNSVFAVYDNPRQIINSMWNGKSVHTMISTTLGMFSGETDLMGAITGSGSLPYGPDEIKVNNYICKRGVLFKEKVFNVHEVVLPSVASGSTSRQYDEILKIYYFYDDNYSNVHAGITSFGYQVIPGRYYAIHLLENGKPAQNVNGWADENWQGKELKESQKNVEAGLYALAGMILDEKNPHNISFDIV